MFNEIELHVCPNRTRSVLFKLVIKILYIYYVHCIIITEVTVIDKPLLPYKSLFYGKYGIWEHEKTFVSLTFCNGQLNMVSVWYS